MKTGVLSFEPVHGRQRYRGKLEVESHSITCPNVRTHQGKHSSRRLPAG